MGDPFGKASFDGHIDQPPLKFANHDLLHLFEQYTFGIWGETPVLPFSPQEKAYDGSEDAYLKMFRDLWVKMHQHKEYSKEDELVYFDLYHENNRYFIEGKFRDEVQRLLC